MIVGDWDSRMIRHVNRVEREPLEFKRLVRTVGTRRQIFFRFSCDVRGTADASGSATTWSPFMAFPGQDPEDRRESKWRTSYGRLRPFVSLSRPVSSPIVYIDRSTIVNAIRDTWKPWNTRARSTLARNDHLGWPCNPTNTMLSNRMNSLRHCRSYKCSNISLKK